MKRSAKELIWKRHGGTRDLRYRVIIGNNLVLDRDNFPIKPTRRFGIVANGRYIKRYGQYERFFLGTF